MATFISISHEDLQAAELDPDERQKSLSKKAFETQANLMDGYTVFTTLCTGGSAVQNHTVWGSF